jgi:hypothetical protein
MTAFEAFFSVLLSLSIVTKERPTRKGVERAYLRNYVRRRHLLSCAIELPVRWDPLLG